MSVTCNLCNDTGSLSQDIGGMLDCAHCPVALQRVALETWAFHERLAVSPAALWAIYQKGMADGKVEASKA